MTRPGWSGRRVTDAIRFVVTRDNGMCGICDHPGANSLDHIKPVTEAPHLEWDPTNWQAAHLDPAGRPNGCNTHGCHCPGNRGRGTIPLDLLRHLIAEANAQTQPRSRQW